MKNGMKRIAYLLILSVFILGMLTGCRQSPVLQQIIYIDKVEKNEPADNEEKKDEEKPEPAKDDLIAENTDTGQQEAPPDIVPEKIPEGEGDTEYSPDMNGGEEASLQTVTDGGIAVEVPQSMYMVTTVTETTRNPHWKSSISYDSDRYTGERKDGIFEGLGTYVWDDGEKYEGEWGNGMYNGQGAYTWANGDKYEGGWKTETFEGPGTYTWASGSYYEGEWKGGIKEGHGTYSWANGDKYEGEWKAGVKDGYGTYTWADGSVYEGEWKYGIKEGQGTYRGADGTVYQGLWANDRFVGQ